MARDREIHLVGGDRGWSAIDRDAGVASEGDTRQEALENLDEVVAVTVGARADDDSDVARPPPDVP